MKQNLINLLSRKMVMFYLSLTAIFTLTFMGKLTGDNFLLVFGWCISAFVIGNVGEWKYKDTSITSNKTEVKQ